MCKKKGGGLHHSFSFSDSPVRTRAEFLCCCWGVDWIHSTYSGLLIKWDQITWKVDHHFSVLGIVLVYSQRYISTWGFEEMAEPFSTSINTRGGLKTVTASPSTTLQIGNLSTYVSNGWITLWEVILIHLYFMYVFWWEIEYQVYQNRLQLMFLTFKITLKISQKLVSSRFHFFSWKLWQ